MIQLKILWHFEIFVNTGPYWSKKLKSYSSYRFHPMAIKLHENIGYHGEYRLLLFLAVDQVSKLSWNFNMGVNGNIINCAICWKRLALERKTRGPRNFICRAPFRSGPLSSIWVIRCTLQNFWCQGSKSCYCPSFYPVSTKPYKKHLHVLIFSKIRLSHVRYGYLPNFKSIWYFEDKLSRLNCQIIAIAKIHKAMLVSSNKRSSRVSIPLGLLLLFVSIGQSEKNYGSLKFC